MAQPAAKRSNQGLDVGGPPKAGARDQVPQKALPTIRPPPRIKAPPTPGTPTNPPQQLAPPLAPPPPPHVGWFNHPAGYLQHNQSPPAPPPLPSPGQHGPNKIPFTTTPAVAPGHSHLTHAASGSASSSSAVPPLQDHLPHPHVAAAPAPPPVHTPSPGEQQRRRWRISRQLLVLSARNAPSGPLVLSIENS